jgi:hypothetical protein
MCAIYSLKIFLVIWHKLFTVKSMKKLSIFCLAIILITGCSPNTKITGSWKNPKQSPKDYNNIFVAVLTGDNYTKSMLENEMELALTRYGIKIEKSMEEFPPNFAKDTVSKETMIQRMRKKGSEAILTVSLFKKETESRYIDGGYYPMAYGYYGNFWGYYNYWYPYVYSPGYYTNDQIYYLETNLYDIKTEALIWSAQTQTYDYDQIKQFSKEFAQLIVDKMKSDGIIKNITVKNGLARDVEK